MNLELIFLKAEGLALRPRRPDWKQAFQLWIPATKLGHLDSQFYVGVCYNEGRGIRKNVKIAFDWFLKAAQRGQMESQYNVGTFFRDGKGVKRIIRRW